jgi:hypothetical protein
MSAQKYIYMQLQIRVIVFNLRLQWVCFDLHIREMWFNLHITSALGWHQLRRVKWRNKTLTVIM